MSQSPSHSLPPSVEELFERFRLFDEHAAELAPANKTNVFAALRDARIASVTIAFDGYGDSGQIEEITALAADGCECEMPATIVQLRRLSFGEKEPTLLAQPLPKAIETLGYIFLESAHCGWENNEGAFGDFTFDVAAETIALDYNARFASSENYCHVF